MRREDDLQKAVSGALGALTACMFWAIACAVLLGLIGEGIARAIGLR